MNRNTPDEREKVRHDLVAHALTIAETSNEAVFVRVCQGDPYCPHVGDACLEAQANGCRFCEVILVHPNGTAMVSDPGQRNRK